METCPACETAVPEGRSVCAGCGGVLRLMLEPPPSRERPGLPFQNEQLPLLRRYTQTYPRLLVHPVRSFADLDLGDSLLHPIQFVFLSAVWVTAVGVALAVGSADHVDEVLRVLVHVVLLVPVAMYGSLLFALPFHACCALWRAGKAGFGNSVAVWGYSVGVWSVFYGLWFLFTSGEVRPENPFVAYGDDLIGLGFAAFLLVGTREVHETSWWQALGAVGSTACVPYLLSHLAESVTLVVR